MTHQQPPNQPQWQPQQPPPGFQYAPPPQAGYNPQGYPPPGPQYPPPGYAQPPNVHQARDRSQYVRQQTGHSLIKHLFLGLLCGFVNVIYISMSPNHYWHA